MPDYDDSNKEREAPFAGKAALISLGQGPNILFRADIGMVLELGEDGAARLEGLGRPNSFSFVSFLPVSRSLELRDQLGAFGSRSPSACAGGVWENAFDRHCSSGC
ncbi:hypothetical protein [Novosphingobium sp.]|uniref:hypothetical protein n=1 Tax=Novosphingobium sp. TaxID=1874826 RepID=UPI001ED1469C|nr:hypothetical protein [Novosphingobium sp.]MBK9009441.1 hypothetical protein [Novosphingobium sp.]